MTQSRFSALGDADKWRILPSLLVVDVKSVINDLRNPLWLLWMGN